jgi:glyoxylase-like metal-dependent hydrolase (beta-lactamase superfamily II)
MRELVQAGERTFYIDCPSKIGVYLTEDGGAVLIDSGIDGSAASRALEVLEEFGRRPDMIINTHSHADHVGGNSFIQERTGCPAYAAGEDAAIIQNSLLNTSVVYGGRPCREMKNKLLYSSPCRTAELNDSILPEGLETVRLDGHSFAMTGIKTSDGVWFIADSLASEAVLEKYRVPFIYDAGKYLDSLSTVEGLDGKLYVPSHSTPMDDAGCLCGLVDINRRRVFEVIERLLSICRSPMCFEEVLKNLFDSYGLVMEMNQYILVGCTIRSLLSFLRDEGRLNAAFSGNRLLWETAGFDAPAIMNLP